MGDRSKIEARTQPSGGFASLSSDPRRDHKHKNARVRHAVFRDLAVGWSLGSPSCLWIAEPQWIS